jgi:hypothetical protein
VRVSPSTVGLVDVVDLPFKHLLLDFVAELRGELVCQDEVAEPRGHEAEDLEDELEVDDAEVDEDDAEGRVARAEGGVEHLAALLVQDVLAHRLAVVVWSAEPTQVEAVALDLFLVQEVLGGCHRNFLLAELDQLVLLLQVREIEVLAEEVQKVVGVSQGHDCDSLLGVQISCCLVV